MAIAQTELGTIVSRRTIEKIAPRTMMLSLVDRSWQGEAANTSEINIRVFRSQKEIDGKDATGAALSGNDAVTQGTFNATTGGNWAEAGDDGMTNEKLSINKELTKSFFVPHVDLLQLPAGFDPVTQASDVLARQFAASLDDHLIADFIAGAPALTAARQVSSANNYIDDQGKEQGSDVAEGVYDLIGNWALHAVNTGFGPLGSGMAAKVIWAQMAPQVWRALSKFLLDKNLNSAGTLNLDLLQSRFNDAAMGATRRVIDGVAIIVNPRLTNKVKGATGATTKDHWPILCGTSEAFTFVQQDLVSRVVGLAENQTGDGTSAGARKRGSRIDSAMVYGDLMIDDRQVILQAVRAEA